IPSAAVAQPEIPAVQILDEREAAARFRAADVRWRNSRKETAAAQAKEHELRAAAEADAEELEVLSRKLSEQLAAAVMNGEEINEAKTETPKIRKLRLRRKARLAA